MSTHDPMCCPICDKPLVPVTPLLPFVPATASCVDCDLELNAAAPDRLRQLYRDIALSLQLQEEEG